MAVSLKTYLNKKLKEKGLTVKEAKKNAGKYKSIAAAKKAGSLYYTNKEGKVMAAVYAEDLKKASVRPKVRPKKVPDKAQGPTKGSVMTLDEQMEVMDANRTTRLSKQLPMSTAGIRKMVLRSLMEVPENQSQSSRFNAWFKQNQAKYKKEDGSYNLSKAVKDFSQLTKRR
tara:strand:+ start:186 stop:698 length:513 start_codon:yes stop_codon:yes gene_type:complete